MTVAAKLTGMLPEVNYIVLDLTKFRSKIELNPLHVAAIYNSREIIYHLLALGADINTEDKFDCTALYHIIIGSTVITTADTESGNRSKYQYSAVTFAISSRRRKNGKRAVVRQLLENGASSNIICRDSSALCLAVLRNNADTVKLLLEHGANPNLPSTFGYTPLHAATRNGCLSIVELLLKYDADPYSKYFNSMTPHDDFSVRNPVTECTTRETLLYISAYTANVKRIRSLTENGVPINSHDNGLNALHLAAASSNIDVVRLLLENKADKRFKGKYFDSGDVLLVTGIWINIKNWNGITPLIIAIRHGFVDIAKMFIKRGAKVNAQDNRGRFSALHCAVFYKYPSIIRMLLEGGNRGRFSALHCAVFYKYPSIIRMLLEGGAEFNALDKRHYTPLHIAVLIGDSSGEQKGVLPSTAALNSKTREGSSLSNGLSLGKMALDPNVTIGEGTGLVMIDVV
ncbi:Ankyrin repeats (3 copies) [Popillia japonica]|uniref:Ankyrin repeats (3 copies) n=1 Tax=Popillia japonica TaxID=7064 RepID=A0AAW1IVE1_POPJA